MFIAWRWKGAASVPQLWGTWQGIQQNLYDTGRVAYIVFTNLQLLLPDFVPLFHSMFPLCTCQAALALPFVHLLSSFQSKARQNFNGTT